MRPRTSQSYADTVRLYIVPAIGSVPLAKLEPSHVSRMLAGLPNRLSPTTRRYAYVVLRIALGRALKQQLVHRNVATLIDPPVKRRMERRPLSAEEVRTFLASLVEDPRRALFTVALATGCRQGEVLALRWQDIDLDTGTITVRHTLERRTLTLADPKTEQARRTLVLPAFAVTALRDHRLSQLEQRLKAGRRWKELDMVFCTGHGTPFHSRNVTRWWQDALERAGLPRQRFHDARHASATLGLEGGETLYEVSRRLGHANISTTADVYGHVTPAMQRQAAERMERILAG